MPRLSALSNQLLHGQGLSYALTGIKDFVSNSIITSASLPSGVSISNTLTHNSVANSLYFNGSQSVPGPTFSVSTLNSFPITIEYWYYATAANGTPVSLQNGTVQTVGVVYGTNTSSSTHTVTTNITNSTSGAYLQSSSDSFYNILLNTWNHCAIVLTTSGGTGSFNGYLWFQNGTLIANNPLGTNFQGTNMTNVRLGGFGNVASTYPFTGYISEIRASSGSRYTGSTVGTNYFTPPSTAFTVDGSTLSLIKSAS
jgi:hypothetical protein